MKRRFRQVDVFTHQAFRGNPLAVVHAAQGLTDDQMAAFARWTNLSETTFVLPPTDPQADYRVRIWTPGGELPFAGHPTLGTCWAWLAEGGVPRLPDRVIQECAVGLVTVRRDAQRLAFAAPPTRRSGPLEPDLLARLVAALRLTPADVLRHQWVDNGPGWCALQLHSARQVRAVVPDWSVLDGIKLGLVGAHEPGDECQFEVRALIGGGNYEDPVTGSLNASLAQWLIGAGVAPSAYVASQGHQLQRAGRIHIRQDGDTIWVGGDVVPLIDGDVVLG